MFCTTCGIENENDVRFCYSCGSAIHLSTTQTPTPRLPHVPPTAAPSVPVDSPQPHRAPDSRPSDPATAGFSGRISSLSATDLSTLRVYVDHLWSGTLGPWTLAQLGKALADGQVATTSLGHYEGSTERKTVSELLGSLPAPPPPGRTKRFLGNTEMNVGAILEFVALLLLVGNQLILFLAFVVAGALLYRSGKRRLDRKAVRVEAASESPGDPLAWTSESKATAPKHAPDK